MTTLDELMCSYEEQNRFIIMKQKPLRTCFLKTIIGISANVIPRGNAHRRMVMLEKGNLKTPRPSVGVTNDNFK